MTLDNNAIAAAALKTNIPVNQVLSTCNLLMIEYCTIPFISRYRKEATGNLDEVQIEAIKEKYQEYVDTEKRRAYVLENLKKNEKLTPTLEQGIKKAVTLSEIEDLYAPYKTKRKTKGEIAKDKGLLPLANMLFEGEVPFTQKAQQIIKDHVGAGKAEDLNDAINGACDILMERFSHNIEAKQKLRDLYWRSGMLESSFRKDGDKVADFEKFKDFFEFKEALNKIADPKNTHRFLAIKRGVTLKVLKMSFIVDKDLAYEILAREVLPPKSENMDLLKKISKKSYDLSISNSIELEVKSELKSTADESAINVFKTNLRSLMLQPYLGAKAVLGIDPGIRTGCKIVVISKNGEFIGDHVIYPFAPKFDVDNSKMILKKLIEMFEINYIAVGNGTNGRETLDFIRDQLPQVQDGKIKAVLVNEDGASIYSASPVAREEFPDKDVTVRGAISIARRFQDPLAELVKIDPKSIGVGQYQHDVNQVRLKKSLETVVENCVNFVGVDINTASSHLLSFISGIGPTVAKNIVKIREKKKGFKNRQELLEVPRFSDKVFQQSAGFMRIYHGENVLDSTFIHPEHYAPIQAWAESKKVELSELISSAELIAQFEKDETLREQLGDFTFMDIIQSLKSPKQDPRSEFTPIEFRADVRIISDLKIGEWYTGVVNNITNFGAFVDIGVKESGLLHISQISDEFVQDPMSKLKVGQKVKVRVIELDVDRKRISLSRKSEDGVKSSGFSSAPRKPLKQPAVKIKNNAFAKLSGFKVK